MTAEAKARYQVNVVCDPCGVGQQRINTDDPESLTCWYCGRPAKLKPTDARDVRVYVLRDREKSGAMY